MTDRSHDGAETDSEDMDKLLYTDLDHRASGLDKSPLKRDHCDLLLDAIDAQLGQLEVQPQKHHTIFRGRDYSVAAPFRWSHSVSKDTGLGSTTQTAMSYLDLIHTPTVVYTSERSISCREGPVVHDETKETLNRGTRDEEEIESRREQVIWRLERLLGDTCKENAMAGEMQPPSDSICTEDFVIRFREEMVDLTLPEMNMQEIDIEEETERAEISDSDTCQSEQKGQRDRGGSAVTEKSGKVTTSSHFSHQKKKLEKCVSDSYGVNISHISDKAGAEERYKPPQPDGNSKRWRTLIQSVTGIDDLSTNQSDYDTATQEKTKPRSSSGKATQRSTHWDGQNRCPPVHKAQCSKIETSRLVSSFDDKDTNEDINHWNRRYRADWVKMKEQLFNLQQKCEKEEETLRLKRNQLKDIELCIIELQQRRKHALQELERLAADTAQMEEEKRTLECVLIDSRAERDSISFQLQKLQKQRESFVFEVRDMEEERVTRSQHEQTLTDGSCMERKSIIISVLEREEMERQLDSAKRELFAEQRRAREKLESMQEKLEETCEALQRATETEISLRKKCACLDEKLMLKREQTETLEAQVRDLLVERGDCKNKLGSLEKMLAQRELQLKDFQEQCGALQTERDGLKVELQHLKTKYYKTLNEAQEQARRIMVKEEEATELRKSLEKQKEEVHKAIDEERRKWEAKVEAVQVHCRILEEQSRKSLQNMRSEMQQEKNKALAIQHKVLELKTKVQELESERCTQQKEQESLLTVICSSLKEDHQVELQRLQKQMAQESQRTELRHEQAVQLAETEADRLRVMLEQRESSHNKTTAELDQQLRNWAQELGAECQHLYLLVEKCGAKQNALHLPLSPSVAEALTNLRTLREQLKHLISHLHQELDSQKQISEQLRKDKERELGIQRQQLRLERDQALDFLKERLIQEHIMELSSLNWAHMSGGAADSGGVAESLHWQLKTKNLELMQVQKNMGQGKEQSAAHLFKDLTAELERKESNIQQERQRKFEKMEGEIMLSAKDVPCLRTVESAASYSPSHMASFNLLCYLQSRVKQLRVENQAYACSPTPQDIALDLSGSHLTTID